MKDKLEEFIHNNYEAFNDLEPNPELWQGINTRNAKIKQLNWIGIAWKVAAAIVIFIASYFFFEFMNRENDAGLYAETLETTEELQVLVDAQAYYTAQIKPVEKQVFQLAGNHPELLYDISLEIKELDSLFVQLRNDLNENMSNEEIIEAMIQNYRTKLMILEETLFQLQKANTTEDETTYEL